jgi:hypothetical protein
MTSLIVRSARVALVALAGMGALGAGAAQATVHYAFTGKKYTYEYPSTGCLTKSMHLSMSIVFAAKLAPNLSNQSVTAVSWVVNDGLHSFKDTEAKAIAPLQATFSTDANGNITAWSVNSYYYAPNGIDILYTTHSKNTGDYSADYKCSPSAVGSNFVAGTWKFN